MKNTASVFNYFAYKIRANETELWNVAGIKKWWRIKYIKCFSWEYWPMWLVYFPASFYFVYLAIRARSFCFFSAANPSIETGE